MAEGQDANQLVTRQRLLEAAGELFAAQGYANATLRDICRRAGANIAAVKYHFGDKEQLYDATVRYAHLCATRHDALGAAAVAAKQLPPEQRLRAFVHAFFLGILEEGRPAWHAKLMAREIAEPTAALDDIAQHAVRPRLEALSAIVREIVGPGASRPLVHACARSIVGQILFYHFARPMLDRVFPDEPINASRVDELTGHVTAFSMHALRGIAGDQKSRARGSGKRGRR
jgi:AcrR family transcriptional regulator